MAISLGLSAISTGAFAFDAKLIDGFWDGVNVPTTSVLTFSKLPID